MAYVVVGEAVKVVVALNPLTVAHFWTKLVNSTCRPDCVTSSSPFATKHSKQSTRLV